MWTHRTSKNAFAYQMLRNRIVLSTNDQGVRGRLLRKSKFTPDSATDTCRTNERTSNYLTKLQ
ncbi:hypothetical protein MHBO_003252 [Bonamia ostreae]|uniref:Uncharacterized protein n=1 Tax=Bonamia ostreae TaxID=126728 RepID=A0ABV2APX0_9EUKA